MIDYSKVKAELPKATVEKQKAHERINAHLFGDTTSDLPSQLFKTYDAAQKHWRELWDSYVSRPR